MLPAFACIDIARVGDTKLLKLINYSCPYDNGKRNFYNFYYIVCLIIDFLLIGYRIKKYILFILLKEDL
jgi:hypothetical protein